jgi:DNA-binding response OmpR family regulator
MPLRVRRPLTPQVLILDDDPGVRAAALQSLNLPLCEVVAAADFGDPVALAGRYVPDLIVLGAIAAEDSSSPLRRTFDAPVVPLFRPSVYARRRSGAVELGPDLILGLADCRIRIRQHLNAHAAPCGVSVRWGGFTVKLEAGAFAFRGQGLGLTKVQAAILSLLMLHGGEIVSRGMIENAVFRDKPKSHTNFISVHISRLRAKLKDIRSEIFIENVKGSGYALFWNRSFSTECIPSPEVMFPGRADGSEPSGFPAIAALAPNRRQELDWNPAA